MRYSVRLVLVPLVTVGLWPVRPSADAELTRVERSEHDAWPTLEALARALRGPARMALGDYGRGG